MKVAALAVAALVAAGATAIPATASPGAVATGSATASLQGQTVVKGFYQGRTVRYLDFGPLKLRAGNRVAPIWAFTNGAEGQRNVIDVVPGDEGYTPLWRVTMVTWKEGATPRVVKSAEDVMAAVEAGEATLKRTNIVVNCPVLGFGQEVVAGFVKGRSVRYLDLGPLKLRAGNKVAPIWAFTNGAEGQRNVIDVVPGDEGYTPLWRVTMVTWNEGVTPRVVRSAEDVMAAVAAGEARLKRTSIVVNCPVI
jgi:hypothetical protein